MTEANPLWGAPRIHGELLKLGIDISERAVSRLMPMRWKPPSQTGKAFLENHVKGLVSIDFFTVPTVRFWVLFVLVVLGLAHHRRHVVHFHVTEHPTAAWTAQQMIEAFPVESARRYLLRDRDKICGEEFRNRVRGMEITEVLIAPQSPWQNAFAEMLVGSIRRECLDRVIGLGEKHRQRMLKSLSLAKTPSAEWLGPPWDDWHDRNRFFAATMSQPEGFRESPEMKPATAAVNMRFEQGTLSAVDCSIRWRKGRSNFLKNCAKSSSITANTAHSVFARLEALI